VRNRPRAARSTGARARWPRPPSQGVRHLRERAMEVGHGEPDEREQRAHAAHHHEAVPEPALGVGYEVVRRVKRHRVARGPTAGQHQQRVQDRPTAGQHQQRVQDRGRGAAVLGLRHHRGGPPCRRAAGRRSARGPG
jgi:hypothetical protein